MAAKASEAHTKSTSYFWPITIAAIVVCYLFWDRISGAMERYKIDPAAWLDSPVVFSTVVGIAGLFILLSVIVALAVKFRVLRALSWAGDRSDTMLISLLSSADARERSMAYAALRDRLDERMTEPLLRQLKTMADDKADPRHVIFLLEDLGAVKALPALRKIAQQSDRRSPAVIRAAQNAVDRITPIEHAAQDSAAAGEAT